METLKRILVYLSRENSLPQCAKFVQSVTGHFSSGSEDEVVVNCSINKNRLLLSDQEITGSSRVLLKSVTGHFSSGSEDEVVVYCSINKNRLLLSDQEITGSSRVLLKSSNVCPLKNLNKEQAASLPEEIQNRGVDAGVAVILQTTDGKVLLTRRAKCLYKFPNVWVPPSGHIELDEEVLGAGLRELGEETGLWLKEGEYTWKMLGLWESVFPPHLSEGLPARHHIMTCVLVNSEKTQHQLQESLAPDESEVNACAWLDPRTVELILSANKAQEHMKSTKDMPATVRVWELRSGFLVPMDLPLSAFLDADVREVADVEQVIPGTKFFLSLWLDTLSQDK